MATPIAHIDRLRIIKLRQKGKTYKSIAEEVGCSIDSVRGIWRRFEARGMEGLKTNYQNSGMRSSYDEMKVLVEEEKTGEQGAPYIRSVLLSRHPDKKIPHERTIQRWWKKQDDKKKMSENPEES